MSQQSWYESYVDKTHRIVHGLLRSMQFADREEIAQEATAYAIEQAEKILEPKRQTEAYFKTIVIRRARRLAGNYRRDRSREIARGGDTSLVELSVASPDSTSFDWGQFHSCNCITDHERTALVLRYLESMTLKDVGKHLQIRPRRVSPLITDALRKLRDCLE